MISNKEPLSIELCKTVLTVSHVKFCHLRLPFPFFNPGRYTWSLNRLPIHSHVCFGKPEKASYVLGIESRIKRDHEPSPQSKFVRKAREALTLPFVPSPNRRPAAPLDNEYNPAQYRLLFGEFWRGWGL